MSRTATHDAYEAATNRVRALHRAEFERIYDEERVERGLKPLLPVRAQRIAELRRRLERLEALGSDERGEV